jgi:hypothetical protein
MADTGTAKSKSGDLEAELKTPKQQREQGANMADTETAKSELRNVEAEVDAEAQRQEEERHTSEQVEQQDLNQGMDTGTNSSIHRGVNWPPGYRVRSAPSSKPEKPETKD